MNSANTANPNPAADRPRSAIVIGASARACAQSLLRAGITPIAIDLFGDRDLKQLARTHICPMDAYPEGIPEILRTQLADIPADVPVVLTGAMENHVEVLREVQSIRPIHGATADAIEKARSYQTLLDIQSAPSDTRINVVPRYPIETTSREMNRIARHWLMKPHKSGAGHGIVPFKPKHEVPMPPSGKPCYFQPLVDGLPWSVLFVTAGGQTRVAGHTIQLVGRAEFGARHPHQYVGNIHLIAPYEGPCQWTPIGRQIALATGLTGAFGIDGLIATRQVGKHLQSHYELLEINPRYTSGMETLERFHNCSVFDWPFHLLPEPKAAHPLVWGKAIVYAKADCRVPDLLLSFTPESIADIPEPGDFVPKGRPICTVLACAYNECVLDQLQQLAHRVYTLCKP